MKKSILLIAMGIFAGFANGQEAQNSILFQSVKNVHAQPAGVTHNGGVSLLNKKSSEKTTLTGTWPGSGGSRWYDYGGQVLTAGGVLGAYPGVSAVNYGGIDIWWDTAAIFGYTSTPDTPVYDINNFTSVGLGFDPYADVWNGGGPSAPFTSGIDITPMDSFYIDSVIVAGWYNRDYSSAVKDSVVDTLIFAFSYGTGAASSNLDLLGVTESSDPTLLTRYSVPTADTMWWLEMRFDSADHRAGDYSGVSVTPVTGTALYKFPLYKTDTNNSDATNNKQFPRPGHRNEPSSMHFSVPAGGNLVGMSVTYRSGDHTFPAFPAHDTVRYSNGSTITGYKYNTYSSMFAYSAASTTPGAAADFPPYEFYTFHDWTSGYFKEESVLDGWSMEYTPNWTWYQETTPVSASELQYPEIVFHVVCPTCNMIGNGTLGANTIINENSVKAYPNPATNVLNITYTSSAAVTVTLTNMVGQVVATQNGTNGRAVFNTTNLPSGVYIYSLQAIGSEHITGRVTIAH